MRKAAKLYNSRYTLVVHKCVFLFLRFYAFLNVELAVKGSRCLNLFIDGCSWFFKTNLISYTHANIIVITVLCIIIAGRSYSRNEISENSRKSLCAWRTSIILSIPHYTPYSCPLIIYFRPFPLSFTLDLSSYHLLGSVLVNDFWTPPSPSNQFWTWPFILSNLYFKP